MAKKKKKTAPKKRLGKRAMKKVRAGFGGDDWELKPKLPTTKLPR